MKRKDKVLFIIEQLESLYPDAHCSLVYQKPYELLIATRLSAQCTDERVNKVTPVLFKKYDSLEKLANADFDDVCQIIHSCGFYRGKAKSIIEMSNTILKDFGGKVPDTIEKLVTLSGVGRKTANLIVGDVYKKPAIIADTHCIRLSNRLGLVDSQNPVIVEKELKAIIPEKYQTKFCHNLVHHGRAVCTARSPKCSECTLSEVCPFSKQLLKKVHSQKTAGKK